MFKLRRLGNMSQNFVAVDREQGFLLPPDVREWLPEGHLAWLVLDAVAEMDLSAFYAASAYPVRSGCGSVAAGHLGVGRRWVRGAEPEQRLEGRHRRAASVVAEGELIEVDLQVRIADAAVGAV